MAGEKKESGISKRRSYAGIFVPAGLLTGMGIGWAFGYLVPGLFAGLGVGFFCFAISMVLIKD